MSTKSLSPTLKPIVGIILLQFGSAGLSIFSKSALNKGISPYVLVVYRHAIAAAVISPFAIVLERSLLSLLTSLHVSEIETNSIKLTSILWQEN